jgi:hypothetical protein
MYAMGKMDAAGYDHFYSCGRSHHMIRKYSVDALANGTTKLPLESYFEV